MSRVAIPCGGLSGEQLREAAASEFSAVTDLVTAALRRHYGLAANDYGVWPHSIYPDRVIVRRDGKLYEFPYALSDANEVTLGAAIEVTLETKPVGPMREAAATEIGQRTELVQAAVRARARADSGNADRYVHVSAIYQDRVVVAGDDRRMYAYPYTLGEDNVVVLGAPYEVVVEHVPVSPATPQLPAMREASASDWLIEAKASQSEASDKASRYLVRVIRAGVSLNNVEYPAKVLREAAPLFANARVFVKGDAEHTKGGGKDFRQLVGRLTEPTFVEAANGGGEIQAVMEILESDPVSAKLREAVERGMTDLFGLSIDATGASKRKGKYREATSITRVDSVDLIIEPGAGGQVIRFTESKQAQEPDMLRSQMLDQIRGRDPARATALENASDGEVLAAYREAFAGGTGEGQQAGVTLEDLQAHTRLIEARADARVKVQQAKLPTAAKERLNTRFLEAKSADELTADKVDAAIRAEAEYGNAFRESAPVSGLGRVEAVPGESLADNTRRMFDDFFGGKSGISFRECYVHLTGDDRLTGQLSRCNLSQMREAAGDRFNEAVNSATFSDILGDSIARRMLELYRNNPLYNDWRDLAEVVPVRDFRSQERGRMGGYGNLPDVDEDAGYAALTSPGDEKAIYNVTKRGGTETISIETIANDDVGLIRRIPQQMATAAARTLYEFVLDFLSSNATIYDTVALFHASHANLATTALSATSFSAMRLAMAKQTELSSAKRLGLVLRHLYLPVELEETAYDLFVRASNNDETFVQSRKPKVHVVPNWTDTNNWYGTADKSDVPLIEIGFFGGNEEPEIFVQDNPSQGSLFTNDQIKYKIRHIYGGAVMDYRGFAGNLVA